MNGKVQLETLSSVVLKENPLGDPRRREIPVYLPPSLAGGAKRRYPVIYYLPGFTGGGRTVTGHKLWQENIFDRYDRMIAEKKAKEAIIVVPDCITAYGGSQYMNSSATGRYEDHIVTELVPFIDDKYPTARSASGRALLGKSSGGFGALYLAMRHPELFSHAASHSGDMLFEHCYLRDFAKFVTELHRYDGSPAKWLAAFKASRDKEGFSHEAINAVGMASCYSPNPRSPLGFDLPFDLRTAEVIPAVWKAWKAVDPVQACSSYKGNLKKLKTLFIDAGRRDEFFLHLGARGLSARLKALGVPHIHEEHERGHFDMAQRYERSLALLTGRLASA